MEYCIPFFKFAIKFLLKSLQVKIIIYTKLFNEWRIVRNGNTTPIR